MQRLGTISRAGTRTRVLTWGFGAIAVAAIAAAAGCGDDSADATTASAGGGAPTSSVGGEPASSGAGGSVPVCMTAAKGPTRGSAIAVSADDSTVVAVNRNKGTVSVLSVDYLANPPKMTLVAEVPVGAKDSEPWQVAIDGCGTRAYVALRKEQKVIAIDNLKSTPTAGASVSVGSEPTSLALTPNNTKLYVSSWVDGTLAVIDPTNMTVASTVDLNKTLAMSGLLGTVDSRPALAHPRGIAITNNGDASDDDETVLVSEFFAQRTGPESVATADTNWKGLLYKVNVGTGTAGTIDLPSVADTLVNDSNNAATGCFPNQVQSVTINGAYAYVTSTCASPKGPSGAFQKGTCSTDAQCGGVAGACVAGSCKGSCVADADCGALGGVCDVANGGACKPNTQNVKTSTHPALTIVDLAYGTAKTALLDSGANTGSPGGFDALPAETNTTFSPKRVPLLPSDIDFVAPTFGYVSAEGTDAVFRFEVDATTGEIKTLGSMTHSFINLRTGDMDKAFRLPIGVATSHTGKGFGFVNDDLTHDVTALDFQAQAIAGGNDILSISSVPDPTADPVAASKARGKGFFFTGLGRWSLAGEGWGSCAACHLDGLTDNVTWYFARGPRQTISLDGTFASKDPTDQRILNWTAIFDEVADFEANTRGVSGGKGALVDAAGNRINTGAEAPPQQGLAGSSFEIANPMGSSPHAHSSIPDWLDITTWIQTIRSPRRPTNLDANDVAEGKKIFDDSLQGNCVGCHSGAKWTISKRFYAPNDSVNAADGDTSPSSLEGVSWAMTATTAGFPSALFPVADVANAKMRSGVFPATESIQCILRPVGTMLPDPNNPAAALGVSDPAVNVLELRQDMKTVGQGLDPKLGRGFNPPSLLGMAVGAPYFHAGNARTLEEAFNDQLFAGHHRGALAQVFVPDATKVKQLVAYLLSIDEDEPAVDIPGLSAKGGDFCSAP